MRFKSLKTKILFWFGSISFFILIIFSLLFYYFFEKSLTLSIQNKLYAESIYIKEHILTKSFKVIEHKFPFAIMKKDKIIYQTKKFELLNIKNILRSKNSFKIISAHESKNAIYILKLSKPFDGAILVLERDIDDRIEDILSTMLVLEPILLILLIFMANNMLNKVLSPIKNINKTAKSISVNNFNTKIPLYDNENEIKELAQTFNNMIDRLKEGVQTIERFNSDVSHELKTPLTVINGQIELALKKDRDISYYKHSLHTIRTESKKIQEITEELLFLSKFSKNDIEKKFKSCDFNAILIEALEKYLKIAKEKNINIEIVRFEKATKQANESLIFSIFSNIIDNAIKYTPNNKNIFVSLYKNEKIHFIIKDEGIGIPKNELSKITDRFYRIDKSRNKKIKGFGLGLCIVKNSVELHNAELKITSIEKSGTQVEVIF